MGPFDWNVGEIDGGTGIFDRLQTITVENRVTLRIPGCWKGRRKEAGISGFFEEGGDTGTLWIQNELYRFPDQSHEEIALLMPLVAQRLKNEFGKIDLAYRNVEMLEVPAGRLIRAYFDEREDGQMLRFFRWQRLQAHSAAITMVFFSLVIPCDRADEPRFRDLVAVMDREIRNAQVVYAIN